EPPGELMYTVMSRCRSSAESSSISAAIRFAMSSSTCWPRKMMRFLSSRWNSRSPGITGASGVAVRATGWTSSVTWSPAPITSGVVQWTLTPVGSNHAPGSPLFADGAPRCHPADTRHRTNPTISAKHPQRAGDQRGARRAGEGRPQPFGIPGLAGVSRATREKERTQPRFFGRSLAACAAWLLRLGLGVLDLFGFLDHFGFRGDLLDDLPDHFGLVRLDRARDVDREVADLDVAPGRRGGLLRGLGREHRVDVGVELLDLGLDVDRVAGLVGDRDPLGGDRGGLAPQHLGDRDVDLVVLDQLLREVVRADAHPLGLVGDEVGQLALVDREVLRAGQLVED